MGGKLCGAAMVLAASGSLLLPLASAAHAAGPAGGVRPASATGCTGKTVCITVAGDGLKVDSVSGGVAVPGGAIKYKKWCGRVEIDIKKGSTGLASYSEPGCATPFSPFNVIVHYGYTFPDGTRACLRATTNKGYYNPGSGGACETIEK